MDMHAASRRFNFVKAQAYGWAKFRRRRSRIEELRALDDVELRAFSTPTAGAVMRCPGATTPLGYWCRTPHAHTGISISKRGRRL